MTPDPFVSLYVVSGTDLIVNGSLILNENFQNGQFGIRLVELPAYAAATRTEFLKVDLCQQIGTDPEGTPHLRAGLHALL